MRRQIHTERLEHDPGIDALEEAWDALLQKSVRPTLFSTFDYVQTSISYLNQGERIFYLTMYSDSRELLAIFPLCIRMRIEHGVACRVIMHALPPQTTEVDKPCPIIHRDHESACWEAFARYVKQDFKQWDIIDLEELIQGSCFPARVKEFFALPGYRTAVKPGPESPIINLSGEWDEFWSHHRKLRKKCGRLERRIEGLRREVTDNPADMERCLEHYIATEKISWKEGEMVAFHKDFYAALLPRLARKGRVCFSIMYDGDAVVSVEMAYTYLDRVYFCHGTYAPDYAVHSPGMVNSCWFIRHFMGKGFEEGDYLAGFASYVDPWASRQELTSHVTVYRIGWKFGALVLFHMARKIKRKLVKQRTDEP